VGKTDEMGMKKPLSDQVVVIGGGSYGLGRAVAVAAARRGATVALGARTPEALEGSPRRTAWTWLRLHRGMFGAGMALATMGLLASREGRFPRR